MSDAGPAPMRAILFPFFSEGAFGPSDQTSFHARGLPVLFFFTGIHADYHTPDDDASRVDAEGEARVVGLVERVVRRLADAPERPEVVQARAPALADQARGYGPYLGTIPAFGGEPVRGVRLQAVRPGSPAAQAGLQAGDVIVEFTGAPVAGLEEFAALLYSSRAGERVEIVFERGGRRLEAWAVLGQRREPVGRPGSHPALRKRPPRCGEGAARAPARPPAAPTPPCPGGRPSRRTSRRR